MDTSGCADEEDISIVFYYDSLDGTWVLVSVCVFLFIYIGDCGDGYVMGRRRWFARLCWIRLWIGEDVEREVGGI